MTGFKFFVRFKQLDGGIYTASGEVMATSYSEAANYIVNYHSWYGKIMSMYLEELPAITATSLPGGSPQYYEGRTIVYGR